MSAQSQKAEFGLSLHQSGDVLTGTVQIGGRLLDIGKGTVHDDSFSFSGLFPSGGKLIEVPFSGWIKGDQIRISSKDADIVASRVQPKPDAERIGRLAGLFRLWGAVKFFHPYVVRGVVDWDAALLTAIPKVEAAKTTEAYGAAVGSMLSELHDPQTKVLTGDEMPALDPTPHQQRVVWNGYYPQVASIDLPYYTTWEAVGPTPAYTIELSEGVRVAIRTAEPASSPAGLVTGERTYGDSLPSRDQRLLALARFWNTIHYFYGYPENIPNWDNVLSEFIPQFESAATRRDYIFTIARLASETNDTHTLVLGFWGQLGSAPPVAVWSIEGQSVVRDVARGVEGIECGDIIVTVDGQPVEQRRKFFLDLHAHSTLQRGLLLVNEFLLAGDGPTVKVGVMKPDGKLVTVELPRTTNLEFHRTTPIYQVLPSGYGYIDLARLPASDIDKAFDAIMRTPGLILDLRGYPDEGFVRYAPRFAPNLVPAALIRRRVWHGPDPDLARIQSTVMNVTPSDKPRYTHRVAVLIDANAHSRPEMVGLLLKAAANPTFIGTPTGGALGDVTNTILPGGVQVNFAGQGIGHPDGRPLQDAGIQPQVWVAPTISGIREGRDEVLEKAVEFLKLSDAVAAK